MTIRNSLKIALTALALGVAAVPAASLGTATQAEAGFTGGHWGGHGHWGHGHWGHGHFGHGHGFAVASYGSDCYRVYRKRFIPGIGVVARRILVCD
jgi:hypothetical protein